MGGIRPDLRDTIQPAYGISDLFQSRNDLASRFVDVYVYFRHCSIYSRSTLAIVPREPGGETVRPSADQPFGRGTEAAPV